MLVGAYLARATTFTPMDDAALVRSSDLVVTGAVERVWSRVLAGGRLVTEAVLALDHTLKGHVRGRTVTVTTPGGRVGERSIYVFGVPRFTVGEVVLLFLHRARGGMFRTSALAMGVYHVAPDASGSLRARRTFPLPDDRPLAAFEAAIRALAVEDTGMTVDTYSRGPILGPVEEFTLAGPPFARWFEPDSGSSVRYLVANGDNVLGTFPSNAAINDAFAAWTEVPTASIVLEHGGSSAPAPSIAGGQCDGKSVVQFNDPFAEIPPLVSCQGVLAVGGFCINGTLTRIVGGTSFRRIGEGDLTVADGFGTCFTQRDLAEILTHEVGHTIGLGHSSENPNEPDFDLRDATMYFLAHLDGRGAALRSDDVAAVTAVYPTEPGPDADSDGVADANDACPGTARGRAVDAAGCACDDAGHPVCDDGLVCTRDACDAQTAACVAPPVDCTRGDPCLLGRCDPTTGCSTEPVTGVAAVTCAYRRPFPPGACLRERVPRSAARGFARAGRLAARAIGTSEPRHTWLLTRADRRLDRVMRVVNRAVSRRRRPLSEACAVAMRTVVSDARARLGAGD